MLGMDFIAWKFVLDITQQKISKGKAVFLFFQTEKRLMLRASSPWRLDSFA